MEYRRIKNPGSETSNSYMCVVKIVVISKRLIARRLAILVAATLAIRKALEMTSKKRLSNVIIESSFIAIQANNGESKPPNQISNLVLDIITLAEGLDSIKFMYCNRAAMCWQIR